MNSPHRFIAHLSSLRLLCFVLLPLALGASTHGQAPQAASHDRGVVTGRVSNSATQVFLEAATVAVLGSNQIAVTDAQGSYHLNLPPGEHTLVVSYPGLETERLAVSVRGGTTIGRDAALTSGLYVLEPIKVEGKREGAAAAIARQRNATNVTNVVAADDRGKLTEDNVGNFLQQLPGITGSFEGISVRTVEVRGIDGALNTVAMDGVQQANTNSTGTSRAFDFIQTSISQIGSIEVTKAPTPDMPGSSIGGNINLVSKSAFSRNPGRVINYSFGLVHPIDRIGGRGTRRIDEPIREYTPTLQFNYSDVFGRNKNIGLTFTYARSVIFGDSAASEHFYQNTPDRLAYMYRSYWYLAGAGSPNIRNSEGVKLEYKLSDRTLLTVNAVHTGYNEVNDTRLFNLQTTNSAASIRPGYSDRYSEAIPSAATMATMNENAWDNVSHNYRVHTTLAQRFDDLTLNYSAIWSRSSAYQNFSPFNRQYDSRKPYKGSLSMNLPNIGWAVDRTQDEQWARYAQTAGPDMYDLNNYSSILLTQNNRTADAIIKDGKVDAKKDFNWPIPSSLKAGLFWQEQTRAKDYHYHRYNYTGTNFAQFRDQNDWVYKTFNGMRQGPWADLYAVSRHKEEHPEVWSEDLNYRYTQMLQNMQDFQETIYGYYTMGTLQWQRLTVLAGVRIEETRTEGNGPLRQLTPAEVARRAAWVGPLTTEEIQRRANAEWGTRTHSEGGYRNVFPGLHLKYTTPMGIVARASHSTSVGRPAITSIIPNTNVNDTARTVAIANTGLKPQYSNNFDAGLEYYFEPIGRVSANVFLKEVDDFIFTDASQVVAAGPNNGFDGLYEGYRITTTSNGGNARYRGVEFNYQQRFTFLPGVWRGFGVNANFTYLETRGNYGGAVATTQVAGFKPRSGNLALDYQYQKYRFIVQANWVGKYLSAASSSPGLLQYQLPKTVISVKLNYNLSAQLGFYLNVDNVKGDPVGRAHYATFEDRRGLTRHAWAFVSGGIQGRF